MNIPKTSAHFSTSLANKISSSASSMTVVSGTDKAGNALSGLYGWVVDKGTASEEFMLGTISGTTVTITARGLDPGDGATEVSALKFAHRRGATVEITDYPLLAILRNILAGESTYTLPALLRYASTVGNPISADDIARKGYVDSLLAGIASTISLLVAGTAGETVAAGNLLYLNTADGRWWKCDADTAASVDNVIMAIAQGAGTAGVAITNGVLLQGIDSHQSGLATGTVYYASNTAGGISASVGTTEVPIGIAKSATELYFNPRFNQQITEDQQDALVGSSGTPSASNKFITENDVAGAATASKVARRNSTGDLTVPTTPTASTDAASKAYLLAQLANYLNQDIAPNTNAVFGTYFTTVLPILSNLGWAFSGTPTYKANGVSLSNAGGPIASITPLGRANSYSANLQWNSGIDLKMAYLFTPAVASTGTVGGTTKYFYHGFGAIGGNDPVTSDSSVRKAMFFHYNGKIYTITSDGSATTANIVNGTDPGQVKHQFMIDFTPTSVKFYIDGALVATHTTNIPTSANDITLSFGAVDSAAGTGANFYVSNVIYSETLS